MVDVAERVTYTARDKLIIFIIESARFAHPRHFFFVLSFGYLLVGVSLHIYRHTNIYTHVQTYTPTYMDTYMHTYMHTYIHTYITGSITGSLTGSIIHWFHNSHNR